MHDYCFSSLVFVSFLALAPELVILLYAERLMVLHTVQHAKFLPCCAFEMSLAHQLTAQAMAYATRVFADATATGKDQGVTSFSVVLTTVRRMAFARKVLTYASNIKPNWLTEGLLAGDEPVHRQ
jgi:hypothetical protein